MSEDRKLAIMAFLVKKHSREGELEDSNLPQEQKERIQEAVSAQKALDLLTDKNTWIELPGLVMPYLNSKQLLELREAYMEARKDNPNKLERFNKQFGQEVNKRVRTGKYTPGEDRQDFSIHPGAPLPDGLSDIYNLLNSTDDIVCKRHQHKMLNDFIRHGLSFYVPPAIKFDMKCNEKLWDFVEPEIDKPALQFSSLIEELPEDLKQQALEKTLMLLLSWPFADQVRNHIENLDIIISATEENNLFSDEAKRITTTLLFNPDNPNMLSVGGENCMKVLELISPEARSKLASTLLIKANKLIKDGSRSQWLNKNQILYTAIYLHRAEERGELKSFTPAEQQNLEYLRNHCRKQNMPFNK